MEQRIIYSLYIWKIVILAQTGVVLAGYMKDMNMRGILVIHLEIICILPRAKVVLSADQIRIYDVNHDGELTLADVTQISNIVADY